MTARRRRPRGLSPGRSPRGFTLLELLITLSVTTIGLIGLLSLHLSVARGNDGAARSSEAQQIVISEIEALRAMRFPELSLALTGTPLSTFTSAAEPPPRFVSGRGAMQFKVTTTAVALVAVAPNLLRIRVVVAWAEDGGTVGSNGGALDHSLALEVIRTFEESL